MPKKIILWLEDSPKSVYRFENYCKKKEFQVILLATDHEFRGILRDNLNNICLIIVDLFIYGMHDLENIEIGDSDTSRGYNAGWVVIERLLQPGGMGPYSEIPVAILSSRTATSQDNDRLERLRAGGKDIPYFEKYGVTPSGQTCGKSFKEFIDQVKRGCR